MIAVCGSVLVVVDVDPRNDGDCVRVHQVLVDLGVRIFAEVDTPGGGVHFYVAGHADIASAHGSISGWPGVDVQSFGANVFLPGTTRAKYGGKGYDIVANDLAAMVDGGDPDGADLFAGWLAERNASRRDTGPAAPRWTGGTVNERYLRGVLANTVKELADVPDGQWNDTLNTKAFKLGQYMAGAGLADSDARQALAEGCLANDGHPADGGSQATINSGLRAGQSWPKAAPEPVDECIPVGVTRAADPPVDPPAPPPPVPVTLDECHAVFTHWLGADYDTEALDAVLASAAVERLDGDPVWLLAISGSGNAKTETVQPLEGAGALIVSTIASQSALLSGTATRDRAKDATGGLLRELGGRGLLVVKDVTSILSMGREMRGEVLGALREVYDGHWIRRVGVDGGRVIDWQGWLVVIGAVTTAWDRAHDVIATMGDRFVLVRMDSNTGRQAAGRKAIANTGQEIDMRAQLAAAVGGVLAGVDAGSAITVTADVGERLLAAADIVTRARTGVEYGYQGDVIDAHAPEMPTRFAKQLAQVVRGGVAIGMTRPEALRLAVRCARDSMPPLRLAILLDVAANPYSSLSEVRARIGKPRTTVDRQLQSLNMLDVLDVDEVVEAERPGRFGGSGRRYTVADGIEPNSLDPDTCPEMLVETYASKKEPKEPNRAYTGIPTNLGRSAGSLLDIDDRDGAA